MRNKNKPIFPLKNKNGIVIMKSDNPDWVCELYNWRGIFLGYAGKKDNSFI